MASTYSPLKIELIGTGEQVATWGQTTNTNLGTTIEQAIGGKADVTMSSTSETLTLTDTNALQNARALYLNLTGTPGGAATLNVPAVQKAYIVKNGTTGGFAVTVKVSGQTGVSVPNGATMHLYNNGTDVVNAVTNLPAGATIGGSAISTASGTVTSVAAGNGMSFSTITGTGSVTLGTPGTLTTTSTNTVAGSSHTHAITTASASTPSTIVARDGTGSFSASTISMTTGNITTGNITTGNITTVNATTNNISGNLAFTGNSNRITGNFSDTTIANQVMFQTSNPNTLTRVQAIPNGTPTVPSDASSAFLAFNSSDPTNSANVNIQASTNEAALRASITGTGTFLPLTFYTSGAERARIAENGDTTFYGDNVIFSGNGKRIKGNFSPYSGDATLFQTTVSAQGTSLGVIPNGGLNDTSMIFYAGTDPANTNFLAAYSANNGTYIDSGSVGTGTTQNFRIITNGSSRIDVAASGEVSVNTATDANTSLIVAANSRTYSLKADARVQFSAAYGYTVGATNRTLFIDSTGDIGGLSSTRESKTNITPIQDADWLMSLEPVSYNRRERDNNGAYTEEANENTEYGLIADDVATIRPELCVFVDGKVSGISYEQLIAPMLKEIQKLRAEVNELKEKLNG
jgi:hypothetical protein